MLSFTVDPRDGIAGASGDTCNSCCCQTLTLRPGETNLVVINYAPWSVPMGGRGIVPTPQFTIEENTDSCNTGPIDGFVPPVVSVQDDSTPVNTVLNGDLSVGIAPVGNVFEYALVAMFGPEHGSVTLNPTTGAWVYTPESGFNGYDRWWFKVTDAQGRTIIRAATIAVGTVIGAAPYLNYGLRIDQSKAVVNGRTQQLSFPIELSPSAEGTVDACKRYRVMIRQPANDCNNTYYHISCLDVYAGKC